MFYGRFFIFLSNFIHVTLLQKRPGSKKNIFSGRSAHLTLARALENRVHYFRFQIKNHVFSCFVLLCISKSVLTHSDMFQGDNNIIATHFCEKFDRDRFSVKKIMDLRAGGL